MDTILLKSLKLIILLLIPFNTVFAQYKTNLVLTGESDKVLLEKMQVNASAVLTEFNYAFAENRKVQNQPKAMSGNAYEAILMMWEMSPFRCYETQVIEKITQYNDNYEVRNIPLFFGEAPEGENYEEVVLIFDKSGIIDNMYISIGTNRVDGFLRDANSVTDYRHRQYVVNFVENFRTSYNRKDIDFIEKVFSDDALIIVGRVVKQQKGNDDFLKKNLSDEQIIYSRKSKAQYINGLKNVFSRNEYLNIKFEEIEVVQHGLYPELYGVTIKQFWNTTTYSDVGYVFLMIDFKDEDKPIIHVRTWQPDKYSDGRAIEQSEIFSLGDFGDPNRK